MASVNLVTSHKGTNHITVDNVRDLIAGISGDITGIKIFSQLDDGLAHTITDVLDITIKTGQALAGGYHFQLTSDYVWQMDGLSVGYSRIDLLYLVIYQDNITFVQTADLVYVPGTAYQNGTAGTEPSAPSGTNILETFKFMRVDLTDGAIVSVTDYSTPYLSNTAVETEFSGSLAQIQSNTDALNGLRFGIDSNGKYGYKKVGADTVTPFRNPTGNAQAANVLKPKTFSNANGDDIQGQMEDRGAVNATVNPGASYSIQEGYHNGSGKVNGAANTGSYTFPAGSGGTTYDMGASNLTRWVNAEQVRDTGRNDKRSNVTIGSVTLNYSGGSGTITVTVGGFSKTYNVAAMGMGTETITGTVGYNSGVTNGAIY